MLSGKPYIDVDGVMLSGKPYIEVDGVMLTVVSPTLMWMESCSQW